MNSTLNDISNYLVNRGYLETITYSFIDSDKVKLLEICPRPIILENPLSENMSIMRPSLLTSLVSVLRCGNSQAAATRISPARWMQVNRTTVQVSASRLTEVGHASGILTACR